MIAEEASTWRPSTTGSWADDARVRCEAHAQRIRMALVAGREAAEPGLAEVVRHADAHPGVALYQCLVGGAKVVKSTPGGMTSMRDGV